MAECTAATLTAGVNGQLPGGGLFIFFNKLAAYLKCAVTLVFVFDGPERPAFKRGKNVRHLSPWWTDRAKDLIHYFGYHIHQVNSTLVLSSYLFDL
jgi:hypothetical protein